jgi:UDP-glucose 4-epimerase
MIPRMPKLSEYTQVLVTGGAGFLGSHLCDRLIADGGTVIGWQPVVGLEESLTRTITYFDELLKAGNKARS